MKCLITGACGFVGQYLAKELVQKGADVVGLERPAAARPGACRVIDCDMLDFPRLLGAIADLQPDQVFHLAGLTHPSESLRIPRDYFLVNVQGTVNLLDALRQARCEPRCLLVSSAEVYGCSVASGLIDETCTPAPSNPYGASKLLAEMAGLSYWRDFRSRVIVARPFNHSGPGQNETFVVSDFCRQVVLLEGKPETMRTIYVGNLTSSRDFLDVRDVVAAYAALAEKGVEGEIYNISSGQAVTVQAILDTVLRLAKVEIRVEVSPEKYRPGTARPLVGSSQKLRALIGWQPRYPLEQTIADTLEHWRAKLT
ncbi:MAG: NAD-dependent epimerase/dehydratase family protein [Acidobacteria bacterium]|nr:MAG: NAD-dependent epimerase/dehydratase family protein [Acidobacteriota bacterium]